MNLLDKKMRNLLLIILLAIIITITVLVCDGRISISNTEKTTMWKINNEVAVSLIDHDSSQNLTKSTKYTRRITNTSPFQYLINNVNNDNETSDNGAHHQISIDHWHKTSKKEQCRLLVDAIYAEDEEWTNSIYFNLRLDNKDIYPLVSLYSERMRICYHCFLMNNIKLSDVFNPTNSRNPLSFQHIMFPILNILNRMRFYCQKLQT